MALRPDHNKVKTSEEHLNNVLVETGVGKEHHRRLLNAIVELIDAKVDVAVTDLENKINKTGEWSPGY